MSYLSGVISTIKEAYLSEGTTDSRSVSEAVQFTRNYNDKEMSYLGQDKGSTEVFVREVVFGFRRENISDPDFEKNAVRYICFDLDYESLKTFTSFFKKILTKINRIGEHKPTNSAYFYLVPFTPKNAKDILWFLSRYESDIKTEVKDKLLEGEKSFDRSKKLVYESMRGGISLDEGKMKEESTLPILSLKEGIVLRDTQEAFRTLLYHKKKLLNGDYMGGGKTLQALSVATLPNSLPALIVVPVQIQKQWQKRIEEKYFKDAKLCVIKASSSKIIPDCDFYICSYGMVSKVEDLLRTKGVFLKTIIGDEVEDIRNLDTAKSFGYRAIAEKVNYAIGLSGTPIGKNGVSLWSILKANNPDNSLGGSNLFREQWCGGNGEDIENPSELREYLLKNGEMVSRTRSQLGMDKIKRLERDIEVSISDDNLSNNENLIELAKKVLSLDVTESSVIGDFGFELRKITAVSKAKSVAQLAKMYLDSGRKVIITGWFREYWDILEKDLRSYGVAFITGTENAKQKDDSKERFSENPNCRVLFLSHLSGAGLDGLEKNCSTIIHGDYPWLVKTIEQLNSRLIRGDQSEVVEVIYTFIEDGSDPLMRSIHRSQSVQLNGIMGEEIVRVVDEDSEDVSGDLELQKRQLLIEKAREILDKNNVSYQKDVELSSFHERVSSLLRKVKVNTSNEVQMQGYLLGILEDGLPDCKIEKEVKISEKSRLDFLVTSSEGERIVIECKTTDRGKKSAHKQVERYFKELGHDSTILFCPWFGVKNAYIGKHLVEIVNYSK